MKSIFNTTKCPVETIQSCANLNELVNCNAFYSLLESFQRHDAGAAHDRFLQLYLNDEGYVDIWRIPHLMLDAVHRRLGNHKLHDEREFRVLFHQFLASLYDWCLTQACSEDQTQAMPAEAGRVAVVPHAATGTLPQVFLQVMTCLDAGKASEVKA